MSSYYDDQSQEELLTRLQMIIESAVDGIVTIDEHGIIETFNHSASRIFGYEPGEVIGKNISILMPEPYRSAHDEYIARYLRTGEKRIIGIGREVLGQRKDGSIFPFFLSVGEGMVNGRRIFTGIVRDMSEQKAAEQKVREYAKALERSNQELESFAYIVSHDLQEPLRKIQAFGERILKKEADRLSEQGRNYLERMLNAGERMQRLIEDLLLFSRITTRRQPYETLSLDEVMAEVLTDLEWQIEQRRAAVEIEGGQLSFEASRRQMHQLLLNLLSNALKFQKEGVPPHVRVRAAYCEQEGKEWIKIEVSDNGIGFDEQFADKIFVIFRRLHHDHEGTGIGLAICKKIVEQHGGRIEARAREGEGATFVIHLPRKQPSA
ncbi:MAG: hypothetical protein KatS3mg033_0254 [Thermonema sp.]|uniref:sensor histidine kinase n=1 Tax=Thermonema sp. TaxID=2231181 RepID=UPI0021DBB163|nr:PAS domain-containing sensor histidine kinase [Thermonema sp.]GIV38454.1 MAG: hypothetical protein KatS3mg033_0254 [Thermonema sp.]